MPDEAREAMLERVTQRATGVLPSVEEVLLAVEEEHDVRPAISPLTVVVAIVLALVLGVGLAAVTTADGGGEGSVGPVTPTLASESPSFSLSPEPTTSRSRSPKPHRSTSASATTTPSATTTTSASPTPTKTAAAVPASIRLSPSQGARGTRVTVSGRGWKPGAVVTVRYRATLGTSTSTAIADDRGRFTTEVTANAPLPGSYTVSATGGGESASAGFQQT
jgi:cytoskeletal protein RodZ